MPNNQQQDKIDEILLKVAQATRKAGFSSNPMTVHTDALEEAHAALAALIEEERRKLEKAYGGCRNCYGKGYATVNDRWLGHDTDQDIGSPGGTITGGNPNAMRFCTCERGKQLRVRIEEEKRLARAEGAKDYNRVLTDALGKPTYVDTEDDVRVAAYYQSWVSDAIQKANAETIIAVLNPSHSEEGRYEPSI